MEMEKNGESSYRRFLRGDQNGLAELICAYSDALVRFAYSFTRDSTQAEDIVSESFAVLCLKRKHFPDENRLRAYLYKIVRNRSLDYLRRHRSHVPLEDLENVLGTGDPEQKHLLDQRNALIYACMQRLPEQYRQVLVLAYLEDFPPKQIGAILHQPAKRVYNLLARARKTLKELLEKEGVTYEDIS